MNIKSSTLIQDVGPKLAMKFFVSHVPLSDVGRVLRQLSKFSGKCMIQRGIFLDHSVLTYFKRKQYQFNNPILFQAR